MGCWKWADMQRTMTIVYDEIIKYFVSESRSIEDLANMIPQDSDPVPNARLIKLRHPASNVSNRAEFSFNGSFNDYGCPCPHGQAVTYRCLCRLDETNFAEGTWIDSYRQTCENGVVTTKLDSSPDGDTASHAQSVSMVSMGTGISSARTRLSSESDNGY